MFRRKVPVVFTAPPTMPGDLNQGDLTNFHDKLWPEGEDPSQLNDSIFHHATKQSSTPDIYRDQQKRANEIAKTICTIQQQLVDTGTDRPVIVRLLDGHGRMLLSIIHAVKALGLCPEMCVRFQMFEIDDEVRARMQVVEISPSADRSPSVSRCTIGMRRSSPSAMWTSPRHRAVS